MRFVVKGVRRDLLLFRGVFHGAPHLEDVSLSAFPKLPDLLH